MALTVPEPSLAWQESAAGTDRDGDERRDKLEIDDQGSSFIVKEHFGSELLFAGYEFLREMGIKPKSFLELFEFIRYCRTRNILKEMAMAVARGGGTHNG